MTDSTFQSKAYHDVGGDDFGPIPLHDGDYQLWERRVDAMMRLLSGRYARSISLGPLRNAEPSLYHQYHQ